MSSNDKFVHQEKFLKFSNVLPLLLLSVVWIFFKKNLEDDSWIIVYTAFLIGVIVVASRRKSAFSVYYDRIEMFNPFSNKLISVIELDQIDQIRYEDSFSDSYGMFWSDFIIIYPKKGSGIKGLKKGRLSLAVTGFNRRARILKLLKFFQKRNLEVVIKTDSKRILKETGLKNWDQVS